MTIGQNCNIKKKLFFKGQLTILPSFLASTWSYQWSCTSFLFLGQQRQEKNNIVSGSMTMTNFRHNYVSTQIGDQKQTYYFPGQKDTRSICACRDVVVGLSLLRKGAKLVDNNWTTTIIVCVEPFINLVYMQLLLL